MRNAPVDSDEAGPSLVGGFRIGPSLPWCCGPLGPAMQPEARTLWDLVKAELLGRLFSLVVDCHSGFGLHDRLWFPFAHTARPMPELAAVHAFGGMMDPSPPHHPSILEPQSRQ